MCQVTRSNVDERVNFQFYCPQEAHGKATCCANSTPRLKSIIVNKRKLNNKHTQRTHEFTWFSKLPTSTATIEKFHYKK